MKLKRYGTFDFTVADNNMIVLGAKDKTVAAKNLADLQKHVSGKAVLYDEDKPYE